MRYLNVLMVVWLILFLPGCGKKKPNGPSEDTGSLTVFEPLKVGNWWKYEKVFWEQGGYTEVDTYAVAIVSEDTVLEGKVAFRLVENEGSDTEWLVIVDDELRMYEDFPDEASDYYIFLKLPLEVGNRWRHYSGQIGGQTLWAEIVSINATVAVPAGTFEDCIQVYTAPYYNAWFTKGVGPVEWSNCNIDSTYGADEKLLEYYVE